MQLIWNNAASASLSDTIIAEGDPQSILNIVQALNGHFSGDPVALTIIRRDGDRVSYIGEAGSKTFDAWLGYANL